MMNWKKKKETLNIGELKLGHLVFDDDYIEISIDICDISDRLKAEIYKSIEIEKTLVMEEREEFYLTHPECRATWSNEPVEIDCNYLSIVLEDGKKIRYSLETCFHDVVNPLLESTATTMVDLTEYEAELKKAIINVLLEKFF